ncbi:MAG: hypothetical protein ACJ8C3_11530 [Microvirga sp.]|jgi:hypothetical protein
MSRNSNTAAMILALAGCVALAHAAEARGGRGGGNGGSGEGDFALRAELQNPRLAEPGSPYGYFRSYSRGPAYPYPFPPRAHRYYRTYGEAPYLYDYQGW